jgi:hypothetical protein
MLEAIEYQVASELLNSEKYKLDEGFRDFAKAVFGDKVISAIEKMPSKMYTVGTDLLDKGKELWDKSVEGFSSFLNKIKEVTQSIIEAMKKILSKLWDLVEEGTKKAGKLIWGKKIEKLEKLADELSVTNEAVSKKHENYKEELSTVSVEFSEMKKTYFKRNNFENVEKQAEDAAKELKNVSSSGEKKVNDSIDMVVYQSFIGLYSVSEASEIDLSNFEINESKEGHANQSKVVKWIQSIVMWIMSPLGSASEFMAKNGSKVLMSIPSVITKGIKNATMYVHVPTVAAIIAGIATDTFSIISHSGGTHESKIFEKENLVSWKNELEEISKSATSAIAGFAMGIAIEMVPGLRIGLEAIMVAGLTLIFFGWLTEQNEKWKIIVPKMCVDFYHWLH